MVSHPDDLIIGSISSGWHNGIWTLSHPEELAPGRISSGWLFDTAVCHPEDISYHRMSSGWLSRNWYLIRMSYDNVIMSSGWHRLPFLSHPDEIADFDFPHHAVALQRFRRNLPSTSNLRPCCMILQEATTSMTKRCIPQEMIYVCLIHWGRVTYMRQKLTIIGSDNGLPPGRRQATIWTWNIINLTLRNKFQWNLNRNSHIFIQENAIEHVVWKMVAIWSRPHCVNVTFEAHT